MMAGIQLPIAALNAAWVDQEYDARLGDPYVFGGRYSPSDDAQGADCSYVVGWVLEAYTKGPQNMSWAHNVSTESWFYDYNSGQPSPPGTVGPYGTIAIASPNDVPSYAALLICIMHGGGGEDSHMNCLTGPAITPTALPTPAGKIMESNGDAGTCTNGTGGTPADSDIWTDWHYLPGPIAGDVRPPPARGRTYTVAPGDTLAGIANRLGVTLAALEAANPQVKDANLIYPGQVLTVP
jgi:hypothetical protein